MLHTDVAGNLIKLKLHFYTPLKHQKTRCSMKVSRGIEMKNWLKIGNYILMLLLI